MVTANSIENTETMSPDPRASRTSHPGLEEVAVTVAKEVDVAARSDLRASILDLLSDRGIFGNLAINPEDPVRVAEEFLDGTWHQTLSRDDESDSDDDEGPPPLVVRVLSHAEGEDSGSDNDDDYLPCLLSRYQMDSDSDDDSGPPDLLKEEYEEDGVQEAHFLIPIILYLDKTGTSDWHRCTLEPVDFSNIDP